MIFPVFIEQRNKLGAHKANQNDLFFHKKGILLTEICSLFKLDFSHRPLA